MESHFGVGAPPSLDYFTGDRDVQRGLRFGLGCSLGAPAGILTHGQAALWLSPSGALGAQRHFGLAAEAAHHGGREAAAGARRALAGLGHHPTQR